MEDYKSSKLFLAALSSARKAGESFSEEDALDLLRCTYRHKLDKISGETIYRMIEDLCGANGWCEFDGNRAWDSIDDYMAE